MSKIGVVQTVLKLKDDMSKPLFRIGKNVDKTNKAVKRSANQLNKWGNTAVKNIDKAVKSSAKLVTGLGAAMAGLGIKTGFSEAMNMEGYRVQLETATKDTEKAARLMKGAVDYANKTPFETGSVVEATAMMESYGRSSERWLSDVADMAGATNKDIIQATEAMSDAVLGEFERMKTFGILKEQLVAAAAEKYGEDVVFNKKGQVMDRLKLENILQQEMQKKFKGGAEALSKTQKGLLSTVTGVTKNALATIVGMQADGTAKQGSMYEQLKTQIELAASTLVKWQKDGTIQKIADSVTAGVNKMIAVFKGLFDFIVKYRTIIETMVVFSTTVYAMAKAVAILKTAITALNVVMMLLNGTLMLSPLSIILISIGAVAAGVYLLYKNWDTLVNAFKIGFEWVKNLVIEVGKFYLKVSGLGLAINLVTKALEGLRTAGSKAFSVVKSILGLGGDDKDITVTTKNTPTPVPAMEGYANGGIANKPSIFGEAGPEIAIPLKKTSRSQELLSQANNMLGGNSGTDINVTITGDVYGFEDFKERVAEAFVKIMDNNGANVVGGI